MSTIKIEVIDTPSRSWYDAPLDAMTFAGYTDDEKRARCEEMAAEARAATKAAEEAVADWRVQNGITPAATRR